jgi:hypothetical protein
MKSESQFVPGRDNREFIAAASAALRACECDGETDHAKYWRMEVADDGIREAFFRDSRTVYCYRDEPDAQPFSCCAR